MSTPTNTSSDDNPYNAPTSMIGGSDGPSPFAESEGGVSLKTVEMLRQTKPWVRFVSVLGFIAAVLFILGGIFTLITISVGAGTGLSPLEVVGFLAVYVTLGLLYLPPSVFLFRYASRIADLMADRRVDNLERALQAQKSFWRFIGIMILVVMAIYALIIVLGVVGFMSIRTTVNRPAGS